MLDTLSSKGVHRVPIVKKDGTVERLVTQSEALRFIAHHVDDFGALVNQTILMSPNLITRGLQCVKDAQPTIDAFRTIIEKNVRLSSCVTNQGSRRRCPLWPLSTASSASLATCPYAT